MSLAPTDILAVAYDVQDGQSTWATLQLTADIRALAASAGLANADPLGQHLTPGQKPVNVPPAKVVRLAAMVSVNAQRSRAVWRLLNRTGPLAEAAARDTGWKPDTPTPTEPPPVVTPAPTPVPAKRKQVIGPAGRQNGMKFAGSSVLRDTHVEGFDHNLVAMGIPSLTLDNVVSVRAFRATPDRRYGGQGLYSEDCRVVIRNSLFGWNGWREDKAPANRSMWRHGWYCSYGTAADIADSILVLNAADGIQHRANDGGTATRCVFVGNGVNFLNSMGRFRLTDSLLLAPNYYAETDKDGNVKAFAGNVNLWAYAPIECSGVSVVALAGQFGPTVFTRRVPAAELHPGYAIFASTLPDDMLNTEGHKRWKRPGTDRLILAAPGGKENIVHGYASDRVWGGDLANKQDRSAFRVLPGGPLTYDWKTVVQSVVDGKMSAADASQKIRDEVAKLL